MEVVICVLRMIELWELNVRNCLRNWRSFWMRAETLFCFEKFSCHDFTTPWKLMVENNEKDKLENKFIIKIYVSMYLCTLSVCLSRLLCQ